MGDAPRNYSDEEVEAILRRALERQLAEEDGYGHEELVAAAREVGLDEGALTRATVELEAERGREAIRTELTKKKRQRWLSHFVTFLALNGAFLGLHALGIFGVWTIILAFFWGSFLALHTFGAARGASEAEVDKEERRRNRKERRAAEARARREAKQRKRENKAQRAQSRARQQEAGQELERVIEEGVSLLLGAAAKRLRAAGEQLVEDEAKKNPQGEFARYVARKKAQEGGRASAPAARDASAARQPRVRVEVGAAPELDDDEEVAERGRSRRRRRR